LTTKNVVAETQNWLIKAVIGLNLCPFAKNVHVKNQIRYYVSEARTEETLMQDLVKEMQLLIDADATQIDTTLIIHPYVLEDFLAYNDFVGAAEEVLTELQLDGGLQIASFHPRYQFEGTAPDSIENYTNRSPYPTLHLLRESSITRGLETYPDTDQIYKNNIETLSQLGIQGFKKKLE
jgi:hypothetical protein